MQIQHLIVLALAWTAAILNWWVPGFREYKFLGTLPEPPTLTWEDRIKK